MNFYKPIYIISLFTVATHYLYYPTWEAGFVTDVTGMIERLEGYGPAGLLNCFGFPGLQHILFAFQYLFYQLFDINPLAWYLIFTSFHILNAYLCFLLSLKIFNLLEIKQAKSIALIGTFFFLLSPYQSEVLVWKVCFNYLIATALSLGSMLAILQWLQTGNKSSFWLSHICFVIGLFTFELCLILPLLILTIYYLLPLRRNDFWKVYLPQFSLLGLYFLINKWVLGVWIGHYGAATHLRFSVTDIMSNFFSYTAKLLGFVRYYRHRHKQPIFEWLQKDNAVYLLSVILILFAIVSLWKYARKPGKWKAIFMLGLLYGIALAPVINLFFYYVLHIENDRYSYLPAVFFFPALALLFSHLPRWFFWSISIGYLMVSIYFLRLTNEFWHESAKIYNALIDSYDEYDAPAVFLLNLPENYNGAPMFGDFSDQNLAFQHTLIYLRRKPYEGSMYDVSQYNMTRPTGGATATMIDSTRALKVEFNQWGNWWWHRGNGMGPGYERPEYRVESHGHHYFFIPKDIPEGSVFLIQEGAAWKRKTFY